MSRYRIGVDIGGTFTDLALHDEATGSLRVAKTLSTPHDPSEGALIGIDLLIEQAGVELREVSEITHATTHGANIIIEQKGARTALLTTEGFGDILIIQRQLRHSPYDLGLRRHAPLVPKELVFEVPERLMHDGSVYRPLDERRTEEIAVRLRELDVEAAALCLLHSYANDDHERRVAEIVRAIAPEVELSLSCEVAPLIREYERASTTAADAYIRPAFQRYLTNLSNALRERGFTGSLFIMQANGGIAGVELTMDAPIRAVESGPAGAVTMASSLATKLDIPQALLFDMGGTTAKAGMITDGRAAMVDAFEIDKRLLRVGTGLPLRIPSVDIIEIGAGGGSIARTELGVIAVGPESAGAAPGPACYRRGGTRATVTDANLVLGYINPAFFNGGTIELGVEEAVDAVRRDVAEPLGLAVEEAAWGIHDAVSANMQHAIRTVSTDRGHDPRSLTPVASGGAAPLHALRIARDLGMRRVIVPAYAGVMSALGLLRSDPRFDLALSHIADLGPELAPELQGHFERLESQARGRLEAVGLNFDHALIERRLDAQYRGQGHTVDIAFPDADTPEAVIEGVSERFASRYAELYGSSDGDGAIQVTALRVIAIAPRPRVELPATGEGTSVGSRGERPAYFPETGGFTSAAVYRRSDLVAGDAFTGPALVEDAESTVVIPPGDRVAVDEQRHLIVDIRPDLAEEEER